MRHKFSSIPPEILSFHLLDRLEPPDLVSLGCVLTLPVNRQTYERAFEDNAYFHDYDGQMFRERAHARLYFIGPLDEDPPASLMDGEYFEAVSEDSFEDRMFRLLKVPAINGPILQVSPGNTTLQMRSAKGDVFYMFSGRPDESQQNLGARFDGEYYYGQSSNDFLSGNPEFTEKQFVEKATARQPAKETDAYVAKFAKHTEELNNLGWRLNKKLAPSRFRTVCSSYSQFWGLDEEGLIWSWSPLKNGRQGVPLVLQDYDRRPITGRVSLIKVGYASSCSALIEGVGIVYWNFRSPVTCWNRGYPTADGNFAVTTTKAIAGTAKGIVDYVILRYMVICLKSDGTLAAANYGSGVRAGVRQTENKLMALRSFNAHARRKRVKFVKISGQDDSEDTRYREGTAAPDAKSYGGLSFAALCSDGSVVFGNTYQSAVSDIKGPISIEGLEGLDIASVSLGVTHHLAMTQQGEVYSWGEDVGGSLAVGKLKDAFKLEGAEGKPDHLTLTKPTKINLPGRAYAVFASKQYSAILI